MAKKKEIALEVDIPTPEVNEAVEETPARTDIRWSDYVLSLLDNTEMYQGHPTVDGLRRVAEILMGEIVTINTNLYNLGGEHFRNGNMAATVQIVFADGKSFCGSADANWRNTDDPYSAYLTAMAETRAEGRALRKALNLRKATKEEIAEAPITEEVEENSKINPNQIKLITTLCKKLDINVVEFYNMGTQHYNRIEDIDYKKATLMCKHLSNYQNNVESIPESIKGFNSSSEE